MVNLIALLALLLSGLAVGVLLRINKSFGCYTDRIERAAEGIRNSNELTRQSHWRTLDEVSAKAAESTLAAERSLALFIAMQKLGHDLTETINNHSRSA